MPNMNQKFNFENLRKKAEKKYIKEDFDIDSFSKEDIQRAFNDLNIYRIELEMQNHELKLTQQRLTDNNKLLKDLYDFSPVGYISLDINGKIIESNRTFLDIINIPKNELIGMQFTKLIHPHDQDIYYHYTRKLNAFHKSITDIRLVRNKAKDAHIQIQGIYGLDVTQKPTETRMAIIDKSDQAETKASLKNIKKQQNQVLQNMAEAIVIIDTEGNITFANNEAANILETPREILQSTEYSDKKWKQFDTEGLFIAEEKLPLSLALINQEKFTDFIHSIVDAEGNSKWISVNASPLFDEEDNLIGAVASFRDITEFYETREKLRLSEEKYRSLVDHINEVIFSVDHRGTITYCSSTDRIGLLYNEKEVIGRNIFEFLPEEQKDLPQAAINNLLEGNTEPFDYEFIDKDGSIKFLKASAKVTFLEDNTFYITGIVQNITEAKIAEEESRKNQELIQAIYDTAMEGILITNQEGKYSHVNPAACQILGYSREEMLKMSPKDIVTVKKEKYQKIVEEFNINGQISSEISLMKKDGSEVIVDIKSLANFIPGYNIAFINDITEKKQWQNKIIASEKKYRRLVHNSPTGILYFTKDGTIQEANDNFIRVLGARSKHDIISKNLFDFEGLKATPIIDEVKSALKTGKNFYNEIQYKTIWGREIYVKYYIIPIVNENDDIIGILVNGEDITQQKNSEIKLRAAYEKLAKSEIQLTELNNTKDKFFSIIAHDLKNPFNYINKQIDSLVSDYDNLSSKEAFDQVIEIKKAIENSYELLENLLTWSRTQTNRINFEPYGFDFYEIVTNNIQYLKDLAAQKQINIETNVELNTIVYADYNMIDSVLRNLILNAIKFSYPGSKIEVNARIFEEEVLVSIHDYGIGIPENDKNKLFKIDENYMRQGTNQEQGTGLGLILSKEFITKNSGNIWFDSTSEQGTIFYFTLKLHKE